MKNFFILKCILIIAVSFGAQASEQWSMISGGIFRALSLKPGDLIGYAACDGGLIMKTTDGGKSWNAVYRAPGKENFSAIDHEYDFVVAAGENILVYSQNAGSGWIRPPNNQISSGEDFYSVEVVNSFAAFAGSQGKLYYTLSTGSQWDSKTLASYNVPFTSMQYNGYNFHLFVASSRPSGTNYLIRLAFALTTGGTFVSGAITPGPDPVTGISDNVILSGSERYISVRTSMNKIMLGVDAGSVEKVKYTTDYGINWTESTDLWPSLNLNMIGGENNWGDLYVLLADSGGNARAAGVNLSTMTYWNTGMSESSVNIPSFPDPADIAFTDTQKMIAAGGAHMEQIEKTTSSTFSFTLRHGISVSDCVCMDARNENELIIGGTFGKYAVTHDAGKTWLENTFGGTGTVEAVLWYSNMVMASFSADNSLRISSDNGATFPAVGIRYFPDRVIALSRYSGSYFFALCADNSLHFSTNGGNTWTQIVWPYPATPMKVMAVSSSQMIAVAGPGGNIFYAPGLGLGGAGSWNGGGYLSGRYICDMVFIDDIHVLVGTSDAMKSIVDLSGLLPNVMPSLNSYSPLPSGNYVYSGSDSEPWVQVDAKGGKAWLAGGYGTFYRSQDNGVNVYYNGRYALGAVKDICLTTNLSGYACGEYACVLKYTASADHTPSIAEFTPAVKDINWEKQTDVPAVDLFTASIIDNQGEIQAWAAGDDFSIFHHSENTGELYGSTLDSKIGGVENLNTISDTPLHACGLGDSGFAGFYSKDGNAFMISSLSGGVTFDMRGPVYIGTGTAKDVCGFCGDNRIAAVFEESGKLKLGMYSNTLKMYKDSQIIATAASAGKVTTLENGGFMVYWTQGPSGNKDIYAVRYDFNGVPEPTQFRISQVSGEISNPILIEHSGKYYFFWERYENSTTTSIVGAWLNASMQHLKADGSVSASRMELAVARMNNHKNWFPEAALLSDNRIVISYKHFSVIPIVDTSIRYKILSANKFELTDECPVQNFMVGCNPDYSQISASPNGGFVILWSEYNSMIPGSVRQISGRRYYDFNSPAGNAFSLRDQYGASLGDHCILWKNGVFNVNGDTRYRVFFRDMSNFRNYSLMLNNYEEMISGFFTQNGRAADLVSRQQDFTTFSNSTNQLVGNNPSSCIYSNGYFFVTDRGANRILVYDTSEIQTPIPANMVIGQNLMSGTAPGCAENKFNGCSSVSSNGLHFAVADTGNNRVLIFEYKDLAASVLIPNSVRAKWVLGQTNMTYNVVNSAMAMPSAVNAAGMNKPESVAYGFSATYGVSLYVADTLNNRILVYNNIGDTEVLRKFENDSLFKAADYVIGQSSFTSGAAATAQNRMKNPIGMCVYRDRLYVADTGNNRVLMWRIPVSANGENAIGVLGQLGYTSGSSGSIASRLNAPEGVCADDDRLFVADTGNNRVLVFPLNEGGTFASQEAVAVLGQSDFTSFSLSPSRKIMRAPKGVYVYKNKLYVCDADSRVLIFAAGMWNRLEVPIPESLFGIATSRQYSGHAVACGEAGTLLVTADGGDTWASVPSGTMADFNDVAAGLTKYIAVGNNGKIKIISYNGTGFDVTTPALTFTEDFSCAYFTGDKTGVVGGKNKILLRFNGNYTPIPVNFLASPETEVKDVFMLADGRFFWVTSEGRIYDSSKILMGNYLPMYTDMMNRPINSIWMINERRGIAVGDSGMILQYFGGDFMPAEMGVRANLHEVCFDPDGDFGFIVGDDGTFLVSYDQGYTWTVNSKIYEPYLDFYSIDMRTRTLGFVCGSEGTIFKSGIDTEKTYGGWAKDLATDDTVTRLKMLSNWWGTFDEAEILSHMDTTAEIIINPQNSPNLTP